MPPSSSFLFDDHRTEYAVCDLGDSVEFSRESGFRLEGVENIVSIGFLVDQVSKSSLAPFINAFHAEAKSDIADTIARIKARGVKAGLVIKPKTPPETVYPYLDDLYMVLVMTVEPGFGGQAFMADMMPKVTAIKQECQRRGLNVLIEVDGGISEKTAPIAAKAGVDICVSGTCVFKAQDIAATIHYLQNPLE